MATLFVDFEGGNNDFAGTSFNVLASGTNGRISSSTFSSSTASFSNDGTLCNINNLLGGSERLFDTAKWTTTNSTITTINVGPPSGIDGNVHSLIDNTTSGAHSVVSASSMYSTANATQYTISLYAKAAGRNEITVLFDTTGTALGVRYNLNTGTVSQSGASATGTISNIGDGWYRLTLTANAAGTNQRITIALTDNSYNSTGIQTYVGDGNSGVYLAGLQLQTGDSATTYEKSPTQYLSIFNGTLYAVYEIMQYLSSTSLFITAISGGTSLANQTVDRQFYIGGRWRTLSSTAGATAARLMEGDNIRIMGSPDPTPIGSGTWAGSRTPTATSITSSTNATPISINCASTMSSLGITTGDTVTIVGHTVNTNANGTWEVTVPSSSGTSFTLNGSTGNGVGGATGTFRKRTSSVVRLPSAITANVASYGNRGEGRTAWTASANVTATLDTALTKEGDVGDSIAIGTAFTTGKAAYKATDTLNLSAYQQLSFWIYQSAGTVIVDGDISLRLCSDALGNTSVHTFNIEGLVRTTVWTPITINLGSNMNSSIQSIALYVDADKGAQTFILSNIIACKAVSSDDSLNLCSLIGKNTSSSEEWYPLMSINGTRVMLGHAPTTIPLTGSAATSSIVEKGYYGTSETVLTYKRETIKTPLAVAANSTVISLVQAGTSSNPVRYMFGWDRTNMTNQNLVTYLDGRNGNGTGVVFTTLSNVIIDKLGVVRYASGSGNSGSTPTNCIFSFEYAIGCEGIGWVLSTFRFVTINQIYSCSNRGQGVWIGSSNGNSINNVISINNTDSAVHLILSDNNILNNIRCEHSIRGVELEGTSYNTFNSGTANGNFTFGVAVLSGYENSFKSVNITDNVTAGVDMQGGKVLLYNCIIDQSSETNHSSGIGSNGRIHLINHDNVTNNNFTTTDSGLIIPQTSIRNTNSGYAWALSPTATTRNSSYPLDLKIATVAVAANSLVTVKAWVRRTNTGLTMGLRLKGGQIAGVTNDITSYMTAVADTWEQITLTFTPTEVGVVEILAECYGGTTFTGYIDDLTITQV